MSITVNGTNGLTFNDASTQNTAATGFGFKNRIINGDMRIDQRNAGASVTPIDGQYTLDRWSAGVSQTSKLTIQQSSSANPGFPNALLVTSSSAYSVVAADYFGIVQHVEGYNMADLAWGTASAKSVTLSAWVYSSLTGTFSGSLRNSALNRSYPFTYSIPTANTWTQISVTIAGDTSGTWLTTNGIGIRVWFSLGTGSTYSGTAGAWATGSYVSTTGAVSIVGTPGATFYITGVQLEKGSTATSFDYRPYGTELALCQRYLPAVTSAVGYGYSINTTTAVFGLALPNTARVSPSGLTVTPSSFTIFNGSNAPTIPSAVAFNSAGLQTADVVITTTGLTAGQGIRANGGTLLFTGCEL